MKKLFFPFMIKKYDFLEKNRRHRLIKFFFFIVIFVGVGITLLLVSSNLDKKEDKIYYFNCNFPVLNNMDNLIVNRKISSQDTREKTKEAIIQKIITASDNEDIKKLNIHLNLMMFADMIRKWSISQWIDPNDPDDQRISTKFIEANPHFTTTFTDFVNWKITSVDIGRQIGVEWEQIEEPVQAYKEKYCNKIAYWKLLYYSKTIFLSIIIVYLFSLLLQTIYYKWIIYIIYGHKNNGK